jgi:hypothetical protein
MRALAAAAALAFVGCHHEPPAKAPAAERPLAKPGDLAGEWVRSDDMDFGYHLVVSATGEMTQTIERGRMGKCVQTATLTAGSEARSFDFAFSKEECDEGGVGAKRTMKVVSFTSDALDVIISGGVSPLHRHYTPAPKSTTGAPLAM